MKSYVLAVCVQALFNGHLGPDIFGHFLLRYSGFPLSEVKNLLVTPVET